MHRDLAAPRTLLLSLVSTALSLIFFFGVSAQAATVEKVKGKQAIVLFEEADGAVNEGDKFFAMEDGKKKGLLEVVKYKGGKAIVKIVKGKAAEGMDVARSGKAAPKDDESAPADEAAADDAAVDDADGGKKKKKKMKHAGAATLFKDITYGAVFGYSMDSQTVSNATLGTQAMTGTGFSLKGIADVPVSGNLNLLARVGAEQFNVQKDSFKTEILYAAVDLLLKYNLGSGSFLPFAMGGLGLHFPLSKSSNILSVNQISSTTVFLAGAGFNFVMGGSSYLQVSAEYGMFPPSNEVSTSFIAARFGLGMRF